MTPEVGVIPGYLMIQGLSIQNFKCFKSLDLQGLPPVNVIVGENGAGKTAFLESIFIAGGTSPEIFLRTLHFRGVGEKVQIGNERDAYESLWNEIFHKFDSRTPATVELIDSKFGQRSLRIEYSQPDTLQLNLADPMRSDVLSTPIRFVRRVGSGEEHISEVLVTEDGVRMKQFPESFPVVLMTPKSASLQETTRRFSELRKRNMHQDILNALNDVFPHIRDLSVEIHLGQPMVFADIKGMSNRLPLSSVSAGVYQFLSMLVAAKSQRNGVVLIDEIENGLFYQRLGAAWRGLVRVARDNSVQLFVTSHSLECLRALEPILEKSEMDFLLLRMERDWETSVTTVRRIEGRKLEAALENRIDVR